MNEAETLATNMANLRMLDTFVKYAVAVCYKASICQAFAHFSGPVVTLSSGGLSASCLTAAAIVGVHRVAFMFFLQANRHPHHSPYLRPYLPPQLFRKPVKGGESRLAEHAAARLAC